MSIRITPLLLTLLVTSSISCGAASGEWEYIVETSGDPQGGIILRYPDVAEPRARHIGQQLSHFGWSTVLIPLTLSDVGNKPLNNTAETITWLANDKGQLNLVLLNIGDTWDESVVASDRPATESPIQGIILIDVPGEISPLPDLPTLDIATQQPPIEGFAERRTTVRIEKRVSTQGLTLNYSTRRAPSTMTRNSQAQSDRHEDQLTRRIRGWLHRNLRGMEIMEPET